MSAAKSLSSTTVAGQERAGSQFATNTMMKTGGTGGMKHGMTYLGAGIKCDSVPGVQAGTPGGSNASTGVNGTVTSSKATVPGRGAAVTEVPAKAMKTGSSGGARKNSHPGFL